MTAVEVAALFNRRPTTVVKWARIGKIRAIKAPGGRGYLFHPDDVASLMEADRPAPTENENGPAGVSAPTGP